jgi:tyrosinase
MTGSGAGSSRVTRRNLLRLGAATLGTAAVGTVGGGLAMPAIARAQRTGTTLRTRVSVSDPTNAPAMLESYRVAVTEMKRRSAANPADPLGWQAQAQVHADHCPHGNWFFLPWHRAYLLAFEDICRSLSGNPEFALPYWDWSQDQQLPAAFTDQNSPLFNGTRQLAAGAPLNVAQVDPEFIRQMLSESSYEIFGSGRPADQTDATNPDWQQANGTSSGVEIGPHNQVHVAIGGDMGDMLSPLDPIFWLHHCNVDRLWVVWNQCGANGTRNANSDNPNWLIYTFRNAFTLPEGRSQRYTIRNLQLINPLGYSYGTGGTGEECRPQVLASRRSAPGASRSQSAGGPRPTQPQKLAKLDNDWRTRAIAVPVNAVVRTSAPASIPVPRSAPAPVAASRAPGGAVRQGGSAPKTTPSFSIPASGKIPSRVVTIISDVTPPADKNVQMRVFVNNKSANAQTPVTDPSYVGTISFFGGSHVPKMSSPAAGGGSAGGGHAGHAGHGATRSYAFDLTQPLNKMKAMGRLPAGDIEVQLVPVSSGPGPSKDVAVSVGKVEISGNRS